MKVVPKLTGIPKQIAWAQKIIDEMPEIDLQTLRVKLATSPEKKEAARKIGLTKENWQDKVREALSVINNHYSAKNSAMWIENRNHAYRDLVEAVFAVWAGTKISDELRW